MADPAWSTNSLRHWSHGPVEIVDLPSYKMVVFHSYVEVYQRVVRTRCEGLACFNNQESWAEFDQGISPATLGNSSGKGWWIVGENGSTCNPRVPLRESKNGLDFPPFIELVFPYIPIIYTMIFRGFSSHVSLPEGSFTRVDSRFDGQISAKLWRFHIDTWKKVETWSDKPAMRLEARIFTMVNEVGNPRRLE